MKRLLMIILWVAGSVAAWAGNTITAGDVDAKVGDVITLPINLSNDKAVCAYQFDMVLPAGVSVVTDGEGRCQAALGSRTDGSHHTLLCAPQSDGAVRLLCYSLNNDTFASTSGTVATVQLKVADGCAVGSLAVTLRDVIISSPDESLVYVPGTSRSSINVASASLRGDVNGDGKVTMADAIATMDYYLHWTVGQELDKKYDVNNDNKVTVADAIEVMNIYLNN